MEASTASDTGLSSRLVWSADTDRLLQLGELENFVNAAFDVTATLLSIIDRDRRPPVPAAEGWTDSESEKEIWNTRENFLRVRSLRYENPLELVVELLQVGIGAAGAVAAIGGFVMTVKAKRAKLLAEARKLNAEARKIDIEAELLTLDASDSEGSELDNKKTELLIRAAQESALAGTVTTAQRERESDATSQDVWTDLAQLLDLSGDEYSFVVSIKWNSRINASVELLRAQGFVVTGQDHDEP